MVASIGKALFDFGRGVVQPQSANQLKNFNMVVFWLRSWYKLFKKCYQLLESEWTKKTSILLTTLSLQERLKESQATIFSIRQNWKQKKLTQLKEHGFNEVDIAIVPYGHLPWSSVGVSKKTTKHEPKPSLFDSGHSGQPN